MNQGLGDFDLIMDAYKCKCPMCESNVEPMTCAFVKSNGVSSDGVSSDGVPPGGVLLGGVVDGVTVDRVTTESLLLEIQRSHVLHLLVASDSSCFEFHHRIKSK